ncbi:MAG TPA: dienelactone hydrolase family protein [Terracidiphilus sp.]|jgi:carboxymethylenebutenolidase|nr:dienelactone hydrolase family protein [Terracidiphilus sp.]
MGERISLRAADGQELGAYVAWPQGDPIAGLVVVQEIFGVNAHIRRVADGYANDGFLAIAPALFDRIEPGVELDYQGADQQRAMSFVPRLDTEKAILDVEAAVQYAAQSTGKKVAVIGYCWGGTIAWLAAARLPIHAAVGYYAGRIGQHIDEQPKVPVLLHFGSQDTHIPKEEVDKVKAAHPEVEIHWYDAGHGFNCDARASYNPQAAEQARDRSLRFLKHNLRNL